MPGNVLLSFQWGHFALSTWQHCLQMWLLTTHVFGCWSLVTGKWCLHCGKHRSTVPAAFLCCRKIKRFLLPFLPPWSRLAQTFSFHCLSGCGARVDWLASCALCFSWFFLLCFWSFLYCFCFYLSAVYILTGVRLSLFCMFSECLTQWDPLSLPGSFHRAAMVEE